MSTISDRRETKKLNYVFTKRAIREGVGRAGDCKVGPKVLTNQPCKTLAVVAPVPIDKRSAIVVT